MAVNILDAFLVTFGIDSKDFESGEREIREGSKRLREETHTTFDGMERGSKKVGTAIKTVRNEVIGLGLAFMGARSITDMVMGMANGAASAERLGNTMGMSTRQIWAWRQAMKGVGGQHGDADAALKSIQQLRMSFQLGNLGADQSGVLARLGIGGNDLRNSNPGDIMRKLSVAQGKMDPQLFASLLQQIGLSGPVTYFLMKGQSSVDQLLTKYEASADQQEELAKKTESLQQQMADLNTKIQEKLVPVLLRIADGLDKIISLIPGGGSVGKKNADGRKVVWEDKLFGGMFTIYADANNGGKKPGAPQPSAALAPHPASGPTAGGKRGGTRAERNNNPGNIEDGTFAKRQAGYAGSDGRFAKFASVEHGTQAMVNLLIGYMRKGKDTIAEIVSRWAPPGENNTSAYIADVEKQTGIGRYQQLSKAQLRSVAAAMAKHEGFRGDIKVNHMTVQTKDANSFSNDLRSKTRRHTVAKADQGVAP